MNQIEEKLSSDAQRRLMWSALGDLSRQVQWPVDGVMQWLDKDDWKHIMTAGLKRHQRMAAGIFGGFVLLGQSTKKLLVGEEAELITIIHAFGDERGVKWSRTSLGRDVPDACFAEAL